MAGPSWLDSSNRICEISERPLTAHTHPVLGSMENFHKARCLWTISIIQDLRNIMNMASSRLLVGLERYSGIRDAMLLLDVDFQQDAASETVCGQGCTHREFCRISCLFFIGLVLQASKSVQFPGSEYAAGQDFHATLWGIMDNLDSFLQDNRPMWQGSAENLFISLFHNLSNFPNKAQSTEYALKLTGVLSSTSYQARRGVEKCLVHILRQAQGATRGQSLGDTWTPDGLLPEMQGV